MLKGFFLVLFVQIVFCLDGVYFNDTLLTPRSQYECDVNEYVGVHLCHGGEFIVDVHKTIKLSELIKRIEVLETLLLLK